MTLSELRSIFWWLGEGKYLLELNDDTVILGIPRHTWNPIKAYDSMIEARFAACGLRVQWKEVYNEELEKIIAEAASRSAAAGRPFSRDEFVARMKASELSGKRR